MSGSSWTGEVTGDLFGVPIIESPFVPAGQVYVLGGVNWDGYMRDAYRKPLYLEPPETIKGHVQRKANEVRRRWGMAEVDYAAEYERDRAMRIWAYAAERRLAMGVVVEAPPTWSGL